MVGIAESEEFVVGTVLNGHYTVVDTLNRGSYGVVVLARETYSKALVAIKCLASIPAAEGIVGELPKETATRLTTHELSFHRKLEQYPPGHVGSKHIISCIDSFETLSHTFLVLEYCPIGDLYEAIMQGRVPRETESLKDLMLQLVDAVQFIHEAGVYHRDIKPENILLSITESDSNKPILKLADFGLATEEKWTMDVGTGSDRYMAPEQFDLVNEGYSPEMADIWAVGICVLNLIFSRNPFKQPATDDLIFADYIRDPISLCDVFPTMSPDTFDVLKYAMHPDPVQRDLSKVRAAILRAESFTDIEMLDSCDDGASSWDFAVAGDEGVICTQANRDLRTPSIAQNCPFFSSPSVGNGQTFSWAKALQSPARAIPRIDESGDENESEEPGVSDIGSNVESDKRRVANGSYDSGLGTSISSLSISSGAASRLTELSSRVKPTRAIASAIRYSSKKNAVGTRNISASLPPMSSRGLAGKYVVAGTEKLKFGKSWSDWMEEEEDDDEEWSRDGSRSTVNSSHDSSSIEQGSSHASNDGDDNWWGGLGGELEI